MVRGFRRRRTASEAASSIRRVFGDVSNNLSISRKKPPAQDSEKSRTVSWSLSSRKFKWFSTFRKRKFSPISVSSKLDGMAPELDSIPGLASAGEFLTPTTIPSNTSGEFTIFVDDDLSQSFAAESARSADAKTDFKRSDAEHVDFAAVELKQVVDIINSGSNDSTEKSLRIHGVSIPEGKGSQRFFSTHKLRYNLAGWYPQPSELETDSLYTFDAVEHLDAESTWLDMSSSFAEEFVRWETIFRKCLSYYIDICRSPASLYPPIPGSIDREILLIKSSDFVRSILTVSKSQGYNLPWLGRNGNLEATVFRFVRTWSCFTGIQPCASSTIPVSTAESGSLGSDEKLIELSHITGNQVGEIEVSWAPDSVVFENFPAVTREGNLFTLTPRYWRSFDSSLAEEDESVKISFALDPAINWLRWNGETKSFQGYIPLFSNFEKLPAGWRQNVVKAETSGEDTHVHVLRFGLTATLSESFPANMVFQQTIRVCLRISVAPWYSQTEGHRLTYPSFASQQMGQMMNLRGLGQTDKNLTEEEESSLPDSSVRISQETTTESHVALRPSSVSDMSVTSRPFPEEDLQKSFQECASSAASGSPHNLKDYNVMAILMAHKMEGYGTELSESSPRTTIDEYFGLLEDDPEPVYIYAESIDFETLSPLESSSIISEKADEHYSELQDVDGEFDDQVINPICAESVSSRTLSLSPAGSVISQVDDGHCSVLEHFDEDFDNQIVNSPFARYFINLVDAVGPVEAEAVSSVLEPQMLKIRDRLLRLYLNEADIPFEKASEYQSTFKAHKASYLTRWMHSLPKDSGCQKNDSIAYAPRSGGSSEDDEEIFPSRNPGPRTLSLPHTIIEHPKEDDIDGVELSNMAPVTPPSEPDPSKADSVFDGTNSLEDIRAGNRSLVNLTNSPSKISAPVILVPEAASCVEEPIDTPTRVSDGDSKGSREQARIQEDYDKFVAARKSKGPSPQVDQEELEIFESIFMDDEEEEEED